MKKDDFVGIIQLLVTQQFALYIVVHKTLKAETNNWNKQKSHG